MAVPPSLKGPPVLPAFTVEDEGNKSNGHEWKGSTTQQHEGMGSSCKMTLFRVHYPIKQPQESSRAKDSLYRPMHAPRPPHSHLTLALLAPTGFSNVPHHAKVSIASPRLVGSPPQSGSA